jgi:plasmid stabilization system protein ParE
MRVRWLRKALANLGAEAEYVAADDPELALQMFDYVISKVATLADFPGLGRPGRVPGTRELVIDRFPLLVPYRVLRDELHVLRVFHTRRKPPTCW